MHATARRIGTSFTRTEPSDERVKLLMENNFPFIGHGCNGSLRPLHPYRRRLSVNYGFAYQAARKLIEGGAAKPTIILPP